MRKQFKNFGHRPRGKILISKWTGGTRGSLIYFRDRKIDPG
jgi:hypothetical protein